MKLYAIKDSFNPNVISLNKEFIVTYEKCEKGLKPSIEVKPIISTFRDLKKTNAQKNAQYAF